MQLPRSVLFIFAAATFATEVLAQQPSTNPAVSAPGIGTQPGSVAPCSGVQQPGIAGTTPSSITGTTPGVATQPGLTPGMTTSPGAAGSTGARGR